MKKKKVGRPKKRGPKKKRKYISKKPKIDGRTLVSHKKYYNFKIIACHNKKQVGVVGKFETLQEAYLKLEELKACNSNIVFKKMVSTGDALLETNDEYLLLEENGCGTKKNSKIKDQYGRYAEVESTSKKWVILDSIPRLTEETFSVHGFNQKTDRKTFSWIYDNIVTANINSRFEIKRVLVYKNKVVIKNDDETFDIIYCKYRGDAIRFYNLLQKTVEKKKQKQIYFIGSYSDISKKRKKLEDDIIRYTGITRKKLQMNETNYYGK